MTLSLLGLSLCPSFSKAIPEQCVVPTAGEIETTAGRSQQVALWSGLAMSRQKSGATV